MSTGISNNSRDKDANIRLLNVRAFEGYDTINAAIAAANPYDLITVQPGTYEETVNIDRSVYLRSADGAAATTIKGGGGSGAADAVVYFGANNVALEGFTIDRNAPDADSRAIAPGGSDGAIIKDNIITNAMRGIQGDFYGRPTNLTITGNTFTETVKYGIEGTEDMTGLLIYGNTFKTQEEGIGLGAGVGIESASIANNHFHADANGVFVEIYDNAKGNTFLDNILHYNT